MSDTILEPLETRGTIIKVELLRGVAAIFVVISHLFERLIKHAAVPEEYLQSVWSIGQTGVYLFFAISGFIMIYTTSDMFATRGVGLSFMIRRFKRIVPLYFISTILYLIFKVTTDRSYSPPNLQNIAMSLAFIPFRSEEGLMQPVYGLGWTLEYEMFFYLVFAVSLQFKRRIAIIFLLSTFAALAAFGTLLDPSQSNPVVFYFTRPVMLYFVLGVAIGLFYLRNGSAIELPFSDIWVSAALIGLCIICITIKEQMQGPALCVVMLLATMSPGQMRYSDGFSKICRWLGRLSYSTYLTHSFILGAFSSVYVFLGLRTFLSLVACTVISVVACLFLAWVTWQWIERPIARLLGGGGALAMQGQKSKAKILSA